MNCKLLSKSLTLLVVLVGIFAATQAGALTIVIDFKDPGSTSYTSQYGGRVEEFDVTAFGFNEADRATVYDAIMTELRLDYHNIPTQESDPSSPIPAGHELDIDFIIGDVLSPPSNGDPEYYFAQVGDTVVAPSPTTLGQAGLSDVRASDGTHPFFIFPSSILADVFTDNIQALNGTIGSNLLGSGNLVATAHAINGTLSHEIGHLLSLEHLDAAGATTPTGLLPLMATGPTGLAIADRVFDREFSYSAVHTAEGGVVRNSVAQLVGAVGTRPVASTCFMGDVNCDGVVDLANDIQAAFTNFTGPGTFSTNLRRLQGDVHGSATGATSYLNPHDRDVDVEDIQTMFAAYNAGGGDTSGDLDPAIPDLIYDPATGEVVLDWDGGTLLSYVLKNESASFIPGAHTLQLFDAVTTSTSRELAEATTFAEAGVTTRSIGFVFPTGLDLPGLQSLLSVNSVSTSLGAALVPFDLIVLGAAVPEPSTLVLSALAMVALFVAGRRRR